MVAPSSIPKALARPTAVSAPGRGKLVRLSLSPAIVILDHLAYEARTGSYDYKALPLPGAQESFDPQLVAASCYNPSTREFVTYDTPESAAAKGAYALLPAPSPFG